MLAKGAVFIREKIPINGWHIIDIPCETFHNIILYLRLHPVRSVMDILPPISHGTKTELPYTPQMMVSRGSYSITKKKTWCLFSFCNVSSLCLFFSQSEEQVDYKFQSPALSTQWAVPHSSKGGQRCIILLRGHLLSSRGGKNDRVSTHQHHNTLWAIS